MPGLSCNIEHLENKSNKVLNELPKSTWTNTQYTSAGALYTMYQDTLQKTGNIHPIGSIFCYNTNTNPASVLGYGEWVLVEKKFKRTWIDLTASDWTATNATLSSGGIYLYGTTMMLRLNIIPSIALNDSTYDLGQINLSNYGLSPTLYGHVKGKTQSDGGQATVVYTISSDGKVSTFDSLQYPNHTHSFTSGNNFYIYHYTTMPSAATMPDNYCDRFYFKRIG